MIESGLATVPGEVFSEQYSDTWQFVEVTGMTPHDVPLSV